MDRLAAALGLGALLGAVGPLWGHLEGPLGRLRLSESMNLSVTGALWSNLERIRGLLLGQYLAIWAALGPSRAVFEKSVGHLGLS